MDAATSTKKVRLNSNNIKEYARKACYIIQRGDEDPIHKDKLAEELGLTVGQCSALIKYMRRCSLSDLERFIHFYPVSSKKGYTFPKTYKEFLPCYMTLYLWTRGLQKTILPMETAMRKKGINIEEYIKENGTQIDDDFEYSPIGDDLNYIYAEDFDMGKQSWFFEKED